MIYRLLTILCLLLVGTATGGLLMQCSPDQTTVPCEVEAPATQPAKPDPCEWIPSAGIYHCQLPSGPVCVVLGLRGGLAAESHRQLWCN